MRGSCCAWTEDFLQNPSNPSPSNVPGIWLGCENNSVKIIFVKIFTRGLLCRRGGHIAISGWQSLSRSFGDTFFELVAVENSRNFDAVYSSRDISISVFGGHTATSGCRSLSKSFMNTGFELAKGENPSLLLKKNTSFVLLIKHVWPFYPQTQYVCAQKNRSEMRGLIKFCMYAHANGKVNLSGWRLWKILYLFSSQHKFRNSIVAYIS